MLSKESSKLIIRAGPFQKNTEIDVNEKMINKIGSVSDNKWFFKLVSHMGRYCMASSDN